MPSAPGASLPDGWVLVLDLVRPDRLHAVLSDGLWGLEVADAPWPPAARGDALPAAIGRALRHLDGTRLSLQIRAALDSWPWESEIAQLASGAQVVPRYLTDLSELAQAGPAAVPLVALGSNADEQRELVQAARQQRRPLVLVDPSLSEAQRLRLERSLRSHWRDPLLLSQALAQTLELLGLPRAACRLYGDGRAQLIDTEQGLRPVTALSIDLVGSTVLLQSLGAEAYAQRLQRYHERCREVILRLQGSLDAPQGDDGLMAYFGFPLAVEDAAARALTAAWQLASGMRDLGLQVRIGVASGQLAVSAQQAFGPEVHLAARLCGAARPGQILVAPSTRDRVGPSFMLEPYGEILTLKDFGRLVDVRILDGLRHAGSGSSPRPAAVSSFVGRRRELDLLREGWITACAGRLQAFVVHGEAGIGKSRLLQEFAAELRAQGQHCLELAGQAQAGSSPFAAVVDALRRHWAIDPDIAAAGLEQRLAQLRPALPRDGDDLRDLARLLVLSGAEEAAPAAGAQRRCSELLLECLQALVEPGPFSVLVDDAHWLDPSSVGLLRRLRDTSASRQLLLVVGERTDSGRAMTLPDAASLELQGLTDGEARELAAELGATLPEQVRQRIIERAEGIPLYLEESLRLLGQRDARADGDVPATLQDLLMVRLDELGPDRALAQLVSILGRECHAVHVDALLAQDDPFVERARQHGTLGTLLSCGLLQQTDGLPPGYRFKHALIRDVAYGSLWTDDRTRLHGLCADLIERVTPDLAQQRPEHLAHHLEAARRLELAQRAWLAAAQLAATRHAHQETLELARRGLALNDQLPADAERARTAMHLHLLVASARIALHGYGSSEVEAAYQAAEWAGSQLADAAHALRIRLGLEACYVMRGDLKRAAELSRASVAATDWAQDARLALQSRWALANVQFHLGDWQSALAGFDDCLAHYELGLHRRSSVQDPAIMCLGYSSWIEFELGHADEALRRVARMLALADELRHPFSTSVALGFAASMKRLCGDVDGAWPHALEAVRVCERGGFQVWLAHAWMVRGQLLSDRGDIRGGADDMACGYDLWVGSGARISCATYLATRAEILLRQGQTRKAAEDLAAAWRVSEQIGEHYYQAELLRLQGLCAWQGSDWLRGEQILTQALDLAEQQRKPGLALRCMLSLGALQVAHGRGAEPTARLRGLLAQVAPQHGSCRDARWARQALQCWTGGKTFESVDHTPWEPR